MRIAIECGSRNLDETIRMYNEFAEKVGLDNDAPTVWNDNVDEPLMYGSTREEALRKGHRLSGWKRFRNLSDMQALYDQSEQREAPVRTFLNGQPKWKPRILGGTDALRPRQLSLEDAIALASNEANMQMSQPESNGVGVSHLYNDGGGLDNDPPSNPWGVHYKPASNYEVRYNEDNTVNPLWFYEWAPQGAKRDAIAPGYMFENGVNPNNLTIGNLYDEYWDTNQAYNRKIKDANKPIDIEWERQKMGFNPYWEGNDYVNGIGRSFRDAVPYGFNRMNMV